MQELQNIEQKMLEIGQASEENKIKVIKAAANIIKNLTADLNEEVLEKISAAGKTDTCNPSICPPIL